MRPTTEATPNPSRRLLVVDIPSSTRDVLARGLERMGFCVSVAGDADHAEDIALAQRPAAIVLEVQLPHRSGLTLIQTMRPQLPHTRFLVLTSYGSVASAVRALRLGACSYLCKPVRAGEVAAVLGQPPALPPIHAGASNRPLTLDEAIWEYVHRTLDMAGSLSEAARRLGLHRQSLKRMLAKHRPPPARLAPPAPAKARPRPTPQLGDPSDPGSDNVLG
jgi:two-component system response regulator RegA